MCVCVCVYIFVYIITLIHTYIHTKVERVVPNDLTVGNMLVLTGPNTAGKSFGMR